MEAEVVAGRTLDIKRCAVDQYKSQQLAQPSCWTPGEPAIGRYRHVPLHVPADCHRKRWRIRAAIALLTCTFVSVRAIATLPRTHARSCPLPGYLSCCRSTVHALSTALLVLGDVGARAGWCPHHIHVSYTSCWSHRGLFKRELVEGAVCQHTNLLCAKRRALHTTDAVLDSRVHGTCRGSRVRRGPGFARAIC